MPLIVFGVVLQHPPNRDAPASCHLLMYETKSSFVTPLDCCNNKTTLLSFLIINIKEAKPGIQVTNIIIPEPKKKYQISVHNLAKFEVVLRLIKEAYHPLFALWIICLAAVRINNYRLTSYLPC